MSNSRSRSQEDKQARREAILDAAEEAFREQRFDKTSMDAIAKSAGLSRALLYVYFQDKADILIGLGARAAKVLFERAQKYMSSRTRGIDLIKAMGEAYVDFYHQDQAYFRILTQKTSLMDDLPDLNNPTEAMAEMMAMESTLMTMMAESIKMGLKDGSIDAQRVDDPMETAMFTRCCIHGAIMVQDADGSPMFDRGELSRTSLLNYTIDMVGRALAAPDVLEK